LRNLRDGYRILQRRADHNSFGETVIKLRGVEARMHSIVTNIFTLMNFSTLTHDSEDYPKSR
ncbi:unnamed protein product, partial [Hymenolepis diminuta]